MQVPLVPKSHVPVHLGSINHIIISEIKCLIGPQNYVTDLQSAVI